LRVVPLLLIACEFAYGGITIEISGNFNRGEAFLLTVESHEHDELTIEWQTLSLTLPGKTEKLLLPADYYKYGEFALVVKDGVNPPQETVINIINKEFGRENLSIAPKYVTPPTQELERINREAELTKEKLATVNFGMIWTLPLTAPVKMPVSTHFGTERLFNGEPRSRHSGIDFAVNTGTPVGAVESGEVILTGDFYFSGKTVYIDHGYGVISIYMHLSEISAGIGQYIKRGEIIGKSGSTGRVTGPHLHLSVTVFGKFVDPEPLLDW
jgi:murein DD-endopeptidase MepM/ murein hydrolase activator NlpD